MAPYWNFLKKMQVRSVLIGSFFGVASFGALSYLQQETPQGGISGLRSHGNVLDILECIIPPKGGVPSEKSRENEEIFFISCGGIF